MDCPHEEVVCLNEFDLVRKYRCVGCAEVMMCDCDEAFGSRILPHQLNEATALKTKERITVTLGFQPAVCRECRGLPLQAHPVAEIYGRSSKIKRYYWREIQRRELELFADWAASKRIEDPLLATGTEAIAARKDAGKQALDEIKELHKTSPKYQFDLEESQAEVLENFNVEVVKLNGVYVKDETVRRAQILSGDTPVSPEQFVALHYEEQGYQTLHTESVPFHVLFGIYMWLVIQDPDDERVEMAGFGDRKAFDEGKPGEMIWFSRPDDFGAEGYGEETIAKGGWIEAPHHSVRFEASECLATSSERYSQLS